MARNRWIGAALVVAALTAFAPSAMAQCYPGLPCPDGGDAAPGNSGQQDPAEPSSGASVTAERRQGSFGKHFHYVGPVNPPDPWLSLRSEPSTKRGHRIMKMPQGTLLRQLERRGFWWYVELTTGERGWAHSKWIKCCKTLDD